MTALTDEQLLQSLNAYTETGGNKAAAAARLSISRSTLEGRLQRAEARGLKPTVAAPSPEERLTHMQLEYEQRLKVMKEQLDAAKRQALTSDIVRRTAFELKEAVRDMPEWISRQPALKHQGEAVSVPCVIWSDWHWGEVVHPSQVNNLNSFNMEIGQRRVERLVDRTIHLCFEHMNGVKYPGIVVNLLGDMVSGTIHDELLKTNEKPIMPVITHLFHVLSKALHQLLDAFENVFVVCVVGNHGRNTRQPEYKNKAFENFDWLLYTLLDDHFQHANVKGNIQFLVPDGLDAIYKVYNHTFLATHGDCIGVKGGDGIIDCLGPILRGKIKLFMQNARIGLNFDTLLMGHWHRYMPMGGFIVNSSLKGYDEYAFGRRMPFEPPLQALWFVHPAYGITAHWPVYVEEMEVPSEREWVSWAA